MKGNAIALLFLLGTPAACLSGGNPPSLLPKACPVQRISDAEAVQIAKLELARRVIKFDEQKYDWQVVEDDCDLRVDIEKKNDRATGSKGALTLSRDGKVVRYLGGM